MKMRSWVLAPVFGLVLGAGVFAIGADNQVSGRDDTFRQLELFGDALAEIRKQYVVEVGDAELIEFAIEGMLRELDPHSTYLNPEEYADFLTVTEGEYGGLGIEVTQTNDLVKIIAPMADTPADRAGLKPGDYIVAADGMTLIGLPLDDAVERLRGGVGEATVLTVAREGFEDTFDVEIVREVIRVEPVESWVIDDTIGYVRVKTFSNRHTADETRDAVRALRNEIGNRMDGLVLDLRSNPGGLLDQAVQVSGLFLDGGEVVSIRSRQPEAIERQNARSGDMLRGLPVVVLVNEGSASASEIVAGALQDRRRAVVIGQRTFGKGSVQSVIRLHGGQDGALRLTTARYYTPAGRSIQVDGIAPDLYIAARPEGENPDRRREGDLPNALKNTIERGLPHAFDQTDAAEPGPVVEYPPEGFDEEGDFQLDRAIEILRDGATLQTALNAN